MADSFQQLVERAKNGEGRAIEELICPHLSAMTAFVRLRLPANVERRESAADVVQSVCRQVIQDLPGLQASNETGFKSWLYRALKNELINKLEYHRAGKRDVAREVGQTFGSIVDDAVLAQSYARAITPSQLLSTKEEIARIEATFDQLPPDYRDVILYVGIAQLTYQEAASLMERTEDSVRQLTFRARARLATLLD